MPHRTGHLPRSPHAAACTGAALPAPDHAAVAPHLYPGHRPAPVHTRPWHEQALRALAGALAAMAAITVLLAMLDDRVLVTAWTQQSVWLKPLKFQVSMALHVATVAWALAWMRRQGLAVPGAAGLAVALCAAVAFEGIYITLQGARGVASHFNRNTPLETVLGYAMAAGAQVLTGVAAWVGGAALWQLARQPRGPATAMGIALGLGLLLAFVLAGWTGALMGRHGGPLPPASLQQLQDAVPAVWPVFGWRLDVGDLRPAHFMAVHVMQALPLLAWLCRRRPPAVALASVTAAALAWTALTLGLATRALAGLGWL